MESVMSKQIARFVIVKRPYHQIIAKLYCKQLNVECHINLYNVFDGRLDSNVVENIILTNNAINSFLKFLVSSSTFFECKNENTNVNIISEKIRGNKLYIIQTKGDWVDNIELENKKEIESLQKKLDNIVKRIYNINFDKDKYENNQIQINSTNTILNFENIINKYLYDQILKEKTVKDYDKWSDVYKNFGLIMEIKKE